MKTRRRKSGAFCSITMALKETAGLYETLKVEWNKKNPNLSKCGEILSKLKVNVDLYCLRSIHCRGKRSALVIGTLPFWIA